MKTAKFILKEIIYPASFLFTVYVLGVYILTMMVKDVASIRYEFVAPSVLLVGYIYLLIACAGNNIFKTELSMPMKILINFASYVVPLLAILMLVSNSRGEDATPISPASIMIVVMAVAIVYAIIATPVLIIRHIINKRKENTEEYKSQFDKI